MTRLPPELVVHLADYVQQERSPAYVSIGKDGRLTDFGGDHRQYGIGELQRGMPVGEQIPFLEALLPLPHATLVLPCIQIESGRWADVHILKEGRQHWVVFLAVVEAELTRLQLYQKANEFNLLQERHAGILDQYLGKELVKALDEGLISTDASGERRHVSILFVDIRGFTTFSENNPPEVAFATLNHYLDAMIRPLLEESAIVDKIMGDAVLGVFGILTMSVSPPHQAVMAALKILTAVRDLNRRRTQANQPVLEVGIGISTGPVAVGILGSRLRKSFSVVGHHVNLAARLQEKAEPFEILVDENTYHEIVAYQQGFQETTFLLKGVSGQVRVYSYHMHTSQA